ncbi:MAG: hypothetical protein K2Y29_20960 [Beijerinckiaceae bacterium]|jgi:hypothetical protein|nr:hypothetical protein [Beijerinckiaceae bacterium]MDO9441323.1 hypothetical protein [Beijerinckiaceae bacterium]
MNWHVKFYSPVLRAELQSLEFASEDEALQMAFERAQAGDKITAVEGPDGETVGSDEIEVWFRENGLILPPVVPTR